MEERENGISRITRIEQQKKNKHRYNIYINDEYEFSVHEDILVKHRLSNGDEVDTKRIKKIVLDEEQQKAYQQAIRFINFKLRSRHELEVKLLEKGFVQEIINAILDKLTQQKYINDQQFANLLTQQRMNTQKKGRRWIEQELAHKGIAKDLVREVISQIDEEAETRIAFELALKKWKRLTGTGKERSCKMNGFLLRKGYPSSTVHRVIRKLLNEEKMEDELCE